MRSVVSKAGTFNLLRPENKVKVSVPVAKVRRARVQAETLIHMFKPFSAPPKTKTDADATRTNGSAAR
jgi:hypothetical protein